MFKLTCKSIHSLGLATTTKPNNFNILRLQLFSSSPTNASISVSQYANKYSFTVGHLMNEFGFSLEKAILASKHLHFESRAKPDAVVSFFKNQGFTHSQIRKVISADCEFLKYKPESVLLPKIEFYRSKGISSTELAKMTAFNIQLLRRSLKHYIIPTFNSLRDLIGSDEGVILMLKGDSRLFTNAGHRAKPNIEILRGAGVPCSGIASLLRHQINLFCYHPDKLKDSIVEVQKMGMHPHRYSYIVALFVLTVTPRSKLNQRMKAYKRWGCSEDVVLASFKVQPCIMSSSLQKINRVMSFCVKEIGWEPAEVVVRGYGLLRCSLTKRILPRWEVYKELVSKRLVKEEFELTEMFKMRDEMFLEKYINCHKNDAPWLLKLYHEKLEALK